MPPGESGVLHGATSVAITAALQIQRLAQEQSLSPGCCPRSPSLRSTQESWDGRG